MTATMYQTGRRLITGGDPDRHFLVPGDDEFVLRDWLDEDPDRTPDDDDAPHVDFLPAPEIASVGAALLGEHFRTLVNVAIDYRWKRRGGQGGGRATLGKCMKVAGLTKHYAAVDFVIWLAADNLRDMRATAYQIEALTFHELMHADIDEKSSPVIHPHDFEGFAKEIEQYGLWKSDAVLMGRAFGAVQLPLFAGGKS